MLEVLADEYQIRQEVLAELAEIQAQEEQDEIIRCRESKPLAA